MSTGVPTPHISDPTRPGKPSGWGVVALLHVQPTSLPSPRQGPCSPTPVLVTQSSAPNVCKRPWVPAGQGLWTHLGSKPVPSLPTFLGLSFHL